MTYEPTAIDIDDITLDPKLNDLVEHLAENVHDQWAQQRLKDGWRYGTERDDKEKLHPCLVPYDELPESEKEYDRKTAIITLKSILKFGFTITENRSDTHENK